MNETQTDARWAPPVDVEQMNLWHCPTCDAPLGDLVVPRAELDRLRHQLAEARGHNGANVDAGSHPVHPDYGPCDAFAVGGMCSVCLETLDRLWQAKEKQDVELGKCIKALAVADVLVANVAKVEQQRDALQRRLAALTDLGVYVHDAMIHIQEADPSSAYKTLERGMRKAKAALDADAQEQGEEGKP